MTAVNSVRSSCPHYALHFHIITLLSDVQEFRNKMKCFASDSNQGASGLDIDVYPFDDKVDVSSLPFKAARTTSRLKNVSRGLSKPMNFARFYLHTILPWQKYNFKKVLYMDTDCVAQACVSPLYHHSLEGSSSAPVAAARRRQELSLYVNFRHPVWKSMNNTIKSVLHPHTVSFNAGVLIIDLEKWTRLNILNDILFWANVNNADPKSRLYTAASNPPLVLALAGRVELFSNEWNFAGLGHVLSIPEKRLNRALILHWTGARKPWSNISIHAYQHRWDKFVIHKC